MSTPQGRVTLLQASVRQVLAGVVVLGVFAFVWSSFSFVLGNSGGWIGRELSMTSRVGDGGTVKGCCARPEAPSKDGTLETWDFAYRAVCHNPAFTQDATAACTVDTLAP